MKTFERGIQWGAIAVGALIYALGLNGFLVANHLAEGGFVGISLLLLYKLHVPIGVSFFILNIPLLIVAWRQFGHEFVLKTAAGVAGVSAFTELTQPFRVPLHDPLLAALYAGVITGIGLGLIFRAGGTTGGSDIIARLLRHHRGIGMGQTLFAIDFLVILSVMMLIGKEVAMYSLVALFVASRVIDFVIEGASSGRAMMIVSDHHRDIIEAIHRELDRGTTLLQARGGYTGASREVIYCVVSRDEVSRVQRIIQSIDPYAFVTVNPVHEVLGEGFTFDGEASSSNKRRKKWL
ncbi:YitT family protein [Alicyclobacillus sendaiensis]|uniref:YitT family protein n=1 Tax=Alicyclobacillus sendaiensis PA2 TaxID=3029425 RepID=A0ABT6Y1K6_ALISE|nr:YitT family protein [Alicyclobacillus sendaiensis]MDI9260764.1 YitT family protein [Alicyclobacillus sendaiensis PA2]